MNNNTLILTPNRRLSATLLRHHHMKQTDKDCISWHTPVILPLQAWLQTTWQNHVMQQTAQNHPVLLTPDQEILLWQKILAESPENPLLLQTHTTAELASKAWTLLKFWQVDIQEKDLALTEDGQAFQRWAETFSTVCRESRWLDSSSLPEIIRQKILSGDIPLPEQIELAGFTEMAPALQALFDAITQQGCTVQSAADTKLTYQTAHKICLADEETEIRTMARWARNLLEKQSKTPVTTIGCIIPRLDTLRDSVLQIFSEVFSEDGTLTAHSESLPFNVSAGKKLSDWPAIRTALLLCKSTVSSLSDEENIRLKYSPFCGSETPVKTLCQDIRQPPSVWARTLSEFLNEAGWPGKRALNSDEFQICHRWLDLLSEFAGFDHLLPPQDLKSAVQEIQQLADRIVYQPQTPPAPVQISGVLEAAGQPFSHLWMMGMDDSQWPFPPRPNPLIPQPLQRALQMPHATSERELHYCRQLFRQLRDETTHLICSYAGQLEDTSLRPAGFLRDLPPLTLQELTLPPHATPAETQLASVTPEYFADDLAPVVTADEKLQGGSRILKYQAACPFRAFAEIRLHAAATDPKTQGLNARDRGNILHKTLESLWKHLGDSETLQQLSPENLQSLIRQFAHGAILSCTQLSPDTSRYLQMEWDRLTRLVTTWVTMEKTRPPFRVLACEKPLTVTLAGMTFKLRMDRVDELQNGSQLIIDYKSGKNASPGHWQGDRPEEPQLPLYCISTDDPISALAFAAIHPEKMKLTGLSAGDCGIPTLHADVDWQKTRGEWQHTLTRLVTDFCEGRAQVDPKDAEKTCEHCHLQTLCRIHEVTLYAD